MLLAWWPCSISCCTKNVREAQHRWRAPAVTCLEVLSRRLAELVGKVSCEHFQNFLKLQDKVIGILDELISQVTTEAFTWKDAVLERQEGAGDMYTQNDHYLKMSFDEAQERIRKILGCTIALNALNTEEQGQLNRLLLKAGTQLDKLITWDARDEASWCMAAALAYHKVVFIRFCDTFLCIVDDVLLRGFVRCCRDTHRQARNPDIT